MVNPLFFDRLWGCAWAMTDRLCQAKVVLARLA